MIFLEKQLLKNKNNSEGFYQIEKNSEFSSIAEVIYNLLSNNYLEQKKFFYSQNKNGIEFSLENYENFLNKLDVFFLNSKEILEDNTKNSTFGEFEGNSLMEILSNFTQILKIFKYNWSVFFRIFTKNER